MIDFAGSGSPLSQAGFDVAAGALGVDAAALWAVVSVETSGCGFLADRRPKILFERHYFSRLTGGKYDDQAPDVSAPSAGGYGASGAHQYDRLQTAIAFDETAALRSASWGLGQIMGDNCQAAGFADAESMVTAMVGSEDAQLAAVAAFIKSSGLDRALRGQDWQDFARHYNGPNYAANNYDGHLAQFYQRYQGGNLPDLTVRAAQIGLIYHGFDPGGVDGISGPATTRAVKAFQLSAGVAQTGTVDAALLGLLF